MKFDEAHGSAYVIFVRELPVAEDVQLVLVNLHTQQ